MKMKVLVACEYSGMVRRAFQAMGHEAWSCDLLPSDDGSPFHIQGDVLAILGSGWDLMIAHPPCDYLTVSGNKWFSDTAKASPGILVGQERRAARLASVEFVKRLHDSEIPRVAIENPIGSLSSMWKKPTQIIQPWMFGHTEQKATCLWLKGLPKLVETDNVYEEMMGLPKRERERLHYLPPSEDRWKQRSKTFAGIAWAMASQWG